MCIYIPQVLSQAGLPQSMFFDTRERQNFQLDSESIRINRQRVGSQLAQILQY